MYLNFFQPMRFRYSERHFFDSGAGTLCQYLGYLEEGSAVFCIGDQRYTLQCGDVVYIPKGLRYSSCWSHRDGDVLLYSIMFDFSSVSLRGAFPFQFLPGKLCQGPEVFRSIVEEMQTGLSGEMSSISRFYGLFSSLSPHMRTQPISGERQKLMPALRLLESECSESVCNEMLAQQCYMSQTAFYLLFRKELGCSPVEYKNLLRARSAIRLLNTTSLPVETICEQLGFSSPSYFRKVVRRYTGMTPGEVRQSKGVLF